MEKQAIHQKAAGVIKSIKYMNIASVTPEGEPWNSPVYCAYDKQLHFFWHSWKENQHSINVAQHPRVFVTLYDSTVPEGTGFGVYFQGTVSVVTDPAPLLHALTHMYQRTGKKALAIKFFLHTFPRRAYQFTPTKVWVNGDGKLNTQFIDIREELNLEKVKAFL